MAEFDKEGSDSPKDFTHDLYYTTLGLRPSIIPPTFGFVAAYLSVFPELITKSKPIRVIPFIAKIAVAGALGYFSSVSIEKLYFKQMKQRILIVRDYVQKHPEQFVEQEPKKFKDVVLPWIPNR